MDPLFDDDDDRREVFGWHKEELEVVRAFGVDPGLSNVSVLRTAL